MVDLQDALIEFNKDKPNWYDWINLNDGEVYSNVKIVKDGAVMPTEEEVNAKIAELQVSENRRNEYPSIADQLDDIFHNGLDAWKATIQTTKDKYPKG
tara:strand:+ start:1983 stop:2276 length:294 start_codon:yes stop_codon:yes gene_type:complete